MGKRGPRYPLLVGIWWYQLRWGFQKKIVLCEKTVICIVSIFFSI